MSSARHTISLIIWHDPGDDPSEPQYGDVYRPIMSLWDTGVVTTDRAIEIALLGAAGDGAEEPLVAWAELPTPSEATVDDIREAADELRIYAKGLHDYGLYRSALGVSQIADRLRALLPGGEK